MLSVVIACNGTQTTNDNTADNTVITNNIENENNIVADNDSIDDKDLNDSTFSEEANQISENVEADNSNEQEDSLGTKNETEEEEVEYSVKESLYVLKSVNVRKGPSTTYEKIGLISRGTIVDIVGEVDGWYEILYNTEIAYVKTDYLGTKEEYDEIIKKEEQALIDAQNAASANNSNGGKASQDNSTSAGNGNAAVSQGDFLSRVVELCNKYRLEAGLTPLTEDSVLDQKAQIRAGEVTVKFDHTRPDGSNCFTVLDGVNFTMAGENIAAGQVTPEQVVEEWMNSPAHRENIMNPDFRKIGVGYTTGGEYGTAWVQIFTN